MEKFLYRIPEAAERLGLSRTKVYELVNKGVIPSVRVDRCRRIRHDALVAFVASLPERAA
jgi:excisionase family DNA binding protein